MKRWACAVILVVVGVVGVVRLAEAGTPFHPAPKPTLTVPDGVAGVPITATIDPFTRYAYVRVECEGFLNFFHVLGYVENMTFFGTHSLLTVPVSGVCSASVGFWRNNRWVVQDSDTFTVT